MVCIIIAHSGFLALSMESVPKEDNENYKVLPEQLFYPLIVLCLFLTAGHAMMTTLQTPAVSKYITDKNLQTKFFSSIKVMEGIIISVCMYVYGYIRQHTGSYTEMSILLIFLSCLGYFFACQIFTYSRQNPIPLNADGSVKSHAEQQVGLQKKY